MPQKSTHHRTLVFTPTYNERGNIELLLGQIFALDPTFEALVVDDNSPDGTGAILDGLARNNPRLHVVYRPAKMGLGSAHRLAFIFAIYHGFDQLVTMDADFSHDPMDIPRLLDALDDADFVIGSRYTKGGSRDYTGYQRFISAAGNIAARILLRLPQREFTTAFRAFNVDVLKNRRCVKLRSSGYTFMMETVFRMHQAGVKVAEVPIHFKDRLYGISKIPRFEVFTAIYKLFYFALSSLIGQNKFTPANHIEDDCGHCKSPYLIEHYGSSSMKTSETRDASAYRCSSMRHTVKPQLALCLQCGLLQVPKSSRPVDLIDLYRDVEDTSYMENRKTREVHFERTFRRIERFLPPPGKMLEIGAYCGFFLAAAQRRNWDCVGVEPSRWAAKAAREEVGVTVHTGTLEDNAERLNDEYDVVVSWDVLEHVESPFQLLVDANRRLRVGGVLCFSTLDMNNWFPRLLGRQWPWIMEMHIYYFTQELLCRWLDEAGFDVVDVSPYRNWVTLRYLGEKTVAIFPPPISSIFRPLTRLLPVWVVIPFSLGDIKLLVARKRETIVRDAKPVEATRLRVVR